MPTLRAILRTPASKLLRGKVDPVPTVAEIITAGNLPAEVSATIASVVRRSRLKRHEKADVARELVAHFQDAVAAGVAPAQAISDFGDPKTAAGLIRRAKIRQRSLLWHLFRAIRWFAAAMLVLYIGLTIRFFLGKPTISVDYVAKLNEPALAAPESDRAWPLYREVAVRLMPKARPDLEKEIDDLLKNLPRSLSTPVAPQAQAWVTAHQPEIAQIRAAAAKPSLGFIYGSSGSAVDPDLYGPVRADRSLGVLSDSIMAVYVPNYSTLRQFANILDLDFRVAVLQGDMARAIASIESNIMMSNQVGKERLLIGHLVSIGIRAMAFRMAGELLESQGDHLTEPQLRQLIAFTTGPTVAADLVTFSGERYMFHDYVQRIFTDDGHGDGRVTPAIREAFALGRVTGSAAPDANRQLSEDLTLAATGGITPVVLGGRKELTDYYNQVMDRMEANLHLPIRNVTDTVDQQVTKDLLTNFRLTLVRILMPSLGRIQVTAERTLAAQEAARLAAALHLHKLRTGSFPDSLTVLVPNELPTLPVDRITGEPLRYYLDSSGHPVIYSVGADRDDDAGNPPINRFGNPEPTLAAEWRGGAPDGDWLLYPPERPQDPDAPRNR